MVFGSFALAWFLAKGLALPSVMGVDGRLHNPIREAHGKPLAMIFICHDCPVCNIYAPELSRIESKYGGRLAISLVYSEPHLTRQAAAAHAKAFGIDCATLLLDGDGRFAMAAGAKVTPEAIVLDANGKLVYDGRIDDRFFAIGRQRSAPTTHDLISALDAVLAHQNPKPAAGPPVGCYIVLPTNS